MSDYRFPSVVNNYFCHSSQLLLFTKYRSSDFFCLRELISPIPHQLIRCSLLSSSFVCLAFFSGGGEGGWSTHIGCYCETIRIELRNKKGQGWLKEGIKQVKKKNNLYGLYHKRVVAIPKKRSNVVSKWLKDNEQQLKQYLRHCLPQKKK